MHNRTKHTSAGMRRKIVQKFLDQKRKETNKEKETQFIFLVPTVLFLHWPALRVERLHHVSSQMHLHSSHAR